MMAKQAYVTDPLRQETAYTFDITGNPAGRARQCTCNAAGQRESTTDALHHQTAAALS